MNKRVDTSPSINIFLQMLPHHNSTVKLITPEPPTSIDFQ